MPGEQIAQLKYTPWSSRESGEYYGRPITEVESLKQPIATILEKLGVDMLAVCPRQLSNKGDVLHAQSMRHAIWSDFLCDEDNGEDEDGAGDESDEEDEGGKELMIYWQNLLREARGCHGPEVCPCCHQLAAAVSPSLVRLQHWQHEHASQDLTISQARWLLNCALEKTAFLQQYPPDYRAPHERDHGTRYWKLETLYHWVHEKEKEALKM
jgi:hypothetical protein